MENEKYLIPFNLEKALSGEPVFMKNGEQVKVFVNIRNGEQYLKVFREAPNGHTYNKLDGSNYNDPTKDLYMKSL